MDGQNGKFSLEKYCFLKIINVLLILSFYDTLSWEPSATKVTQIYSRRLPAPERFYREKVDPLNLQSQNQAKNIPVGLSTSLIKI